MVSNRKPGTPLRELDPAKQKGRSNVDALIAEWPESLEVLADLMTAELGDAVELGGDLRRQKRCVKR
ncbi:hypothetical protein FF1_024689 [Malus domestica]